MRDAFVKTLRIVLTGELAAQYRETSLSNLFCANTQQADSNPDVLCNRETKSAWDRLTERSGLPQWIARPIRPRASTRRLGTQLTQGPRT